MVKSKKKRIIICAICDFLIVLMSCIIFLIPKRPKTEDIINPTEFEATVSNIVEQDGDYLIALEEYNCKLFLETDSMISEDKILNIVSGSKIFFKVADTGENPLQNSQIEQVFVFVLRTETEDIVTLESYYAVEKKELKNIKNTCIMAIIVLCGIMLVNVIKIIKNSNKYTQS